MGKKMGWVLLAVALGAWVWTGGAGLMVSIVHSGEHEGSGLLEVDCNIAGIPLSLCPKEQYNLRETKVFFGLVKSEAYVCGGGEIAVGQTPLRPTQIPAGKYILTIPPDYVWERSEPIELTIRPGEKTYFLLKLFSARSNPPESNYGGGGGGGGGGGAR